VITFGSNVIEIGQNNVLYVNGYYYTLPVYGILRVGAGGEYVENVGGGIYYVFFANGYASYQQYYVNWYATITIVLYGGTPSPTGFCTYTHAKRSFDDGQAWGDTFRVTNATEVAFDETLGANGETFDQVNDPDFDQSYDDPPITDQGLYDAAVAYCSILNGTNCAPYVDYVDYYSACLYDILATGGSSALLIGAGSIDAYESECALEASLNGVTIALPPSAASTTAYGSGLGSSLTGNTAYIFTIQSQDVNGNVITTGGSDFEVSSVGPVPLTFEITDNEDGTYTVAYTTPNVLGAYTISVLYRGVDQISGSPFTVNVVDLNCGDLSACGAACYDPSAYTCVGGQLSPNNNGECGGQTYDTTFYQCIDNELCQIGFQLCAGVACYDPADYVCIVSIDQSTLCPVTASSLCGTTCYDASSFNCCTDKLC